MTENKAASKDLAERHVKALASWHAAAIKVRECEAATAKARDELDVARRQMHEANAAFAVALGLEVEPIDLRQVTSAHADLSRLNPDQIETIRRLMRNTP